jgi:hypothetical protein
MLRVTTSDEVEGSVVYLAGRVSGGDVRQLALLGNGGAARLLLDLSQVLSADDAGVATLRNLRHQGAVLRAASPYLRLLLDPEEAELR